MQTHSKRARQRRCRWTALPSSQPPAVDMPFPRHASQFCTMSASTLHSTWLHEQLHILQHMKLHGKCKSQNTRMTEAGNWNEVTRCDAKAVSLEKTSRPRLAASPHACCSRTGQPFSVQLAGSLRPPHRSQRPSCRRCCLATKASTCEELRYRTSSRPPKTSPTAWSRVHTGASSTAAASSAAS